VLATGKVRHVGELVAMCVAPTRAEAEDIAASVTLDLEELPAVHDMRKAREGRCARWCTSIGATMSSSKAPSRSTSRGVRCADQGHARNLDRAAMHVAARRTRRVVATFDHRLDQLTLYTGAQMPHIVRNGLSDCLGIEQGRIRIVSPDVGGGFGHKGILLPEEVCLGWLRCDAAIRCAGSRIAASI
jgi:carbon-monoxide dehydrogenase large subunit